MFGKKTEGESSPDQVISRLKPFAKDMAAFLDGIELIEKSASVVASLSDNEKLLAGLQEQVALEKDKLTSAIKELDDAKQAVKDSMAVASKVRSDADADASAVLQAAIEEGKSIVEKAKDQAATLTRQADEDRASLNASNRELREHIEFLNKTKLSLEETLSEQQAQIKANDEKIAAFNRAAKQFG